jgi:NitT/TauT family transport system ATP-binding protein
MTQTLTPAPQIIAAGHETFPPVAVALRGVSKQFGHGAGAVHALDRVSLEVRSGEFVCLLGASGCGKSTILTLIAGLDRPTSGSIELHDGRPSLMFQEAALFPWLTVDQNVEFPLRMRRLSRSRRRDEVGRLLQMVHLAGFAKKRPHELSGGMRQRVALARALAQGSPLLLMDEPFGALDAMMRDRLHEEIERLWQEAGLTILFVTHNVREAVRLGDRVVVLSSRPGRVAAEYPVDLPRPRRIESPDVARLAASITDRLREEAERHAAA